jgi:hypothetical protein
LGEPVNGDRVSFSHVSYPEGGGRDALFILESPFWLGMGTLRYGLPERMKPPSSTRSADSAERKSGGFFESISSVGGALGVFVVSVSSCQVCVIPFSNGANDACDSWVVSHHV